MSTWDILHIKSLDIEHAVAEADVRLGLAEARLSRDDCVRRPGEDRWWHIYERSEFREADHDAGAPPAVEEPPRIDEEMSLRGLLAEAEPPQVASVRRSTPSAKPVLPLRGKIPTAPLRPSPAPGPHAATIELDEGLPYRKKHREAQEELDMTPMVDVAMQLILFFMVTSTMILQSCIPIPKPTPEEGRAAATSAIPKLDDLKRDNILVKIKGDNTIWVGDEKQATPETDLRARLDTLKRDRAVEDVLISTDETAYNQTFVAVVDAANNAGMHIKMVNPTKIARKAPAKKRIIKGG